MSTPEAVSPRDFELLVQAMFQSLGYTTEHTGGSGDGGIDLRLVGKDGSQAIAQCKRYGGSIGPAAVRELYGALMHEQADRAYLITTGTFSLSAEAWAQGKPIILVDGAQLSEIAGNFDDGDPELTDVLKEASSGLRELEYMLAVKEDLERIVPALRDLFALFRSVGYGGALRESEIERALSVVDDIGDSLAARIPIGKFSALAPIAADVATHLRTTTSFVRSRFDVGELVQADMRHLDDAIDQLSPFLDRIASVIGNASEPPATQKSQAWRFWRRQK